MRENGHVKEVVTNGGRSHVRGSVVVSLMEG